MNIDLTFAQNYSINTDAWLPPSPGSIPLYYYPGASKAGGQDGSLLEIAPNGGVMWLGMFARGFGSSLSGIYGYPDGQTICVVSSGRCYFVKASDPEQWRQKTESITEVRVLPDHNMLLLQCDEGSLIAYGAYGFLWKTEVLSHGGLTIEAIEGNVLHVKALHYRQDDTLVDYEVNLVTGKHKGG